MNIIHNAYSRTKLEMPTMLDAMQWRVTWLWPFLLNIISTFVHIYLWQYTVWRWMMEADFFFHFAFIATMLSNLIRDTSWADFPSHMIINCVYNTQILSTVCEKGWACVAALLIRSPRGMCFEMLPVDDDYNIMYVRHVPWKTLHRLHNSNFNSFNIQMYCSYVHTLCICMHIEDYYYNLYYARTQNLWMCFNS